MSKTLPFSPEKISEIIATTPTPFHIYDEAGMRANARALRDAFSWNTGFREFFAVKACPNPYIMKILKDTAGFGADCSSLPELMLAESVGITDEHIMFTSNDTPADEFIAAKKLGAVINLDDISHLYYLEKVAGLPDLLCFRYNPGSLKEGNTIIGHPEEAKYGLTRDQLFEAYRYAKEKGVKRFGIHTMVASNELNAEYFTETADILFSLVVELNKTLGISFDFVNIGGGIGIPYKPEQKPVDLAVVSDGIRAKYESIIVPAGLAPLKLYMECGRMVTGPFGYLVSTVRHIKKTYKTFVGLDSSMANLMRPALYGSYHHITVVGKEKAPHTIVCDVTGSLCENNDKFAIDRAIPECIPGDIVVIHDAGAHGHAMGFNYNGKLRSSELLLREDGTCFEIRRAETVGELFGTLDFEGLKRF